MSRIGNRVLTIPSGVTVTVENNMIKVNGPKGSLETALPSVVTLEIADNTVKMTRKDETATSKSLHGTTNANVANMMKGVSEGFAKSLEIIGVGYRFQPKGNTLVINAGYSHPVEMNVPAGLTVEAVSNTEITIKGIDKALVGEFAAVVRKVREPEPYKGKGIRYKDEYVRRKEGKKASK